MSIVDTHAHLYLDAFEDDLDEVVARAGAVGVEKPAAQYRRNNHTAIEEQRRPLPSFFYR